MSQQHQWDEATQMGHIVMLMAYCLLMVGLLSMMGIGFLRGWDGNLQAALFASLTFITFYAVRHLSRALGPAPAPVTLR